MLILLSRSTDRIEYGFHSAVLVLVEVEIVLRGKVFLAGLIGAKFCVPYLPFFLYNQIQIDLQGPHVVFLFQVGAFAVRIIDLKFQVLAGVFQFEGRVPSRVVGILLRLCPPNFLPTAAYFFKTDAHWVRL